MMPTAIRARAAAPYIERLLDALYDTRLSFAARGIFARLADEDTHVLAAAELAAEGRETEAQILDAMQELRATGYVRLQRNRTGGGRATVTAHVEFGMVGPRPANIPEGSATAAPTPTPHPARSHLDRPAAMTGAARKPRRERRGKPDSALARPATDA